MQKPKQFTPKRVLGASKFVPKQKKRSSSKLGYDSHWGKYRFRFLHHNPTCYACGFNGGKSLHVDHIVPHRQNDDLFWKVDNYIPLCRACHGTVTRLFDTSETPDTEGKLKWLAEMRIKNNITAKVKIVPFKD